MRRSRSWMNVSLLLALLSAGCRLPGHDGSAPQSLTDCRRLSQQGVAALDRGQQQKAEELLAKAVAACPVDAEARRHYAEALWRRAAQGEAIAQLEEAGRLAGDDASLWARLAEMHLASGQPELARHNAELALSLDPKDALDWNNKGLALNALGKTTEAEAAFAKAKELGAS